MSTDSQTEGSTVSRSFAAGLARHNVKIILTAGNEAVQAAKTATQTIPIVMAFSGDPVGAGFLANLARSRKHDRLSRINIEQTSQQLELLTRQFRAPLE